MKKLPVLILTALLLGGCAAHGPYHAAVVVEHDAASVTKALQQAEMAEFNAGRITPIEHRKIEALIEKVALAGVALNNALQAGVPASVSGALSTFVNAVNDLNTSGVLGIKNETSQAVLTTSINTLKALIENLKSNLPPSVALNVIGGDWGELPHNRMNPNDGFYVGEHLGVRNGR